MGVHIRNLSSFGEMKVQLWQQKCLYVSQPSTAGCGPFINDSWVKLQRHKHISILFFISSVREIKYKNWRNNIAQGSSQAETCLKVMCQFLRILYHLALFLSQLEAQESINTRVCVYVCSICVVIQQNIFNYLLLALSRKISDIQGPMHHFPLQQMKRQMGRLRIQSGDRNTHTYAHTRLIVCLIPKVLDQT